MKTGAGEGEGARAATRFPSGSLLLCGSTASGKSAVALELAQRLNAELVSVDSMQVYRGMDLGTAKPTLGERAGIPHHGLDLVDVGESYSVARYLEQVQPAIADVGQRGGRVICCGGSGLYFQALLHGLAGRPAPDPLRRAQLEATPLDALLAQLAQVDPLTHATIDRANPRRVIRALESAGMRTAGTGPRAGSPTERQGEAPDCFGLRRTPEDLRRRIGERVEAMFRQGLVDEVRSLLERGLAQNRTAMQAIGYRQVVEHVRGMRTLEATVELVKQKTWQYARRQSTWFRRQMEVRWLEVEPQEPAGRTAERILDLRRHR